MGQVGMIDEMVFSNSHRMELRLVTVVACLALASACSSKEPGPWLQFRGPGGMGISSEKGFPTSWNQTENVVWKIGLPGPGSSPIVVGDRIYLAYHSGFNVPGERGNPQNLKRHAVCLNRADGSIVWSKEVESKLPEQERIRENHGYASNTPACDGERIYFFFGKTGVIAFDLDGRQLWQAEVGAGLNDWGSAASPILHGELLIVNASVESSALVALERKTGKEVWRTSGIRESWNTPILVKTKDGKIELVVAIFGKVLGFDPDTGKQLWSCATDIGWYMVPCLVADEGVVYCVGGRSGGGLAVRTGGRGDITRSHRLWTIRKGSNVTSPIFHQGHLYWMHDGLGIAYCAETKTGRIVYEERIPRAGEVYASAVLAGGNLYYITRDGRTLVVAAGPEFKLLATNDLRDRSTFNASPALAAGRIYIRSERFLYCIGSK